MYLAPYVPGKGSPSRPTFRSRPTLRSPNPSSVRIAVAQRRDVSPNRDPDAAAAAMEAQRPVAKGQPADAATMEGQAPDAMAGPSLPLAVAAEGQAAAAKRLATRARDDLATIDARGLPVPIAQGLAAAVDDVAVPEGSMDGEAPPPATAMSRNCSKKSRRRASQPRQQGRQWPGSLPRQRSRPSSTHVRTTRTEGAVSAIKRSWQIHV